MQHKSHLLDPQFVFQIQKEFILLSTQNLAYGSTTGTKGIGYVYCHCEPHLVNVNPIWSMWGQDGYQGIYSSPPPMLVLCVAVIISVAHVAMWSHMTCMWPFPTTCDMWYDSTVNNGVGWKTVSLVSQVRVSVRVWPPCEWESGHRLQPNIPDLQATRAVFKIITLLLGKASL